MAVTNYHTIGGQILSEQTGGVRTEYVHDGMSRGFIGTDSIRMDPRLLAIASRWVNSGYYDLYPLNSLRLEPEATREHDNCSLRWAALVPEPGTVW